MLTPCLCPRWFCIFSLQICCVVVALVICIHVESIFKKFNKYWFKCESSIFLEDELTTAIGRWVCLYQSGLHRRRVLQFYSFAVEYSYHVTLPLVSHDNFRELLDSFVLSWGDGVMFLIKIKSKIFSLFLNFCSLHLYTLPQSSARWSWWPTIKS